MTQAKQVELMPYKSHSKFAKAREICILSLQHLITPHDASLEALQKLLTFKAHEMLCSLRAKK